MISKNQEVARLRDKVPDRRWAAEIKMPQNLTISVCLRKASFSCMWEEVDFPWPSFGNGQSWTTEFLPHHDNEWLPLVVDGRSVELFDDPYPARAMVTQGRTCADSEMIVNTYPAHSVDYT
ncbi:hypothetical protein EVAR_50820_1 [Eumeta japonica]|uniref:Uncharacterized protein n=1 Tax=Eumeta variegata TaxID=151549 RepID=A0A4C1XD32_EUMVA|nr:hypothetical protein EVAR_50820_1 [Eumeta japonica]